MKPVFFDSVVAALEAGFATGHNVLLYGPPGHNKSGGAEWFFREKGITDVFIKSISGGTTIEDLYGGVDIKKMRDKGIIEYRLDSPEFFGNHEYVIFDEILDAKEKVLAALKDTLMAREVRNGAQRRPIKTKMIIGLTNVDAKDFADNWERAAILERFPIRELVKWDDYSPSAFTELIKAVLDDAAYKKSKKFCDSVAVHAATSYEEGKGVTPRNVVQAVKAVADTGKEDFGWAILNTSPKTTTVDELPAEIGLKWRVQEMRAHVAELFRKKDFARIDKKRAFLSQYLTRASEVEKKHIKPLHDELEKFLYTELLG